MKELTYEDWQKNPTPRMMLVWDDDPVNTSKMKVIYISDKGVVYPVVTTSSNEIANGRFKHCAEIEKTRRMTNKELSRWLREKPTRELKYNHCGDNCIHSYLDYYECNADKEVDVEWKVREDDGEWQDPLVEVEEWQ